MPTPFTHLEVAQRLIADDALPPQTRAEIKESLGAFLLGSIAADARVNAGTDRAATHFYHYGRPIDQPPHQIMLSRYPALQRPTDNHHRAFIAGYVAHLSVDEHWTTHMTHPYFGLAEWADMNERFYMLHIILIYMDERDHNRLEAWQADALHSAQPQDWLPFMPDAVLRGWQHLIYDQIRVGGISQTLTIFGGRIGKSPAQLRHILDAQDTMQARLWRHIPQTLLTHTEAAMYTYAREQVAAYWEATSQP